MEGQSAHTIKVTAKGVLRIPCLPECILIGLKLEIEKNRRGCILTAVKSNQEVAGQIRQIICMWFSNFYFQLAIIRPDLQHMFYISRGW